MNALTDRFTNSFCIHHYSGTIFMRFFAAFSLSLTASVAGAQNNWFVDASAPAGGHGSASAPFTSIQSAIDFQLTLTGDSIWVLPGVYMESVDFRGKSLTVSSTNGPIATSISSTTLQVPAVVAASGEQDAVIRGFTLDADPHGGYDYHNPQLAWLRGAYVYCSQSTLLLDQCIILVPTAGSSWSNSSQTHGAVYNAGQMSITHCQVAGWRGYLSSAIENEGSLHLTSSSLDNCSNWQGDGGALSGGTACLTQCTLGGCWSLFGNGGAISDSQVTALDCSFGGNGAGDGHSGGAVYGGGTFVRCVFGGNAAQQGGAIWGGTAIECKFSSNCADGNMSNGPIPSGGAVFAGSAIRCTFTNNYSPINSYGDGGGGAGHSTWFSQCTMVENGIPSANNCTLVNCIEWAAVGEALVNCIVSFSNTRVQHVGPGNISSDPRFVDAPAHNYALLQNSPCIDTGDPSAPLDPDGTRADMGAYPATYNLLTYCTARINSAGCTPEILGVNTPSISSGDFWVVGTNVLNNKVGLFYWGQSAFAAPFFGGTRCVAYPITRTQNQASGGSVAGVDCTGIWSWQLTSGYASTAGLTAGSVLYGQYWGRDPGYAPPNNVSLTNAIRIILLP